MKEVYILEHSYEINNLDETKFIGIYSSLDEAQKAIERLKKQPGFKDRPNDFHIDKNEINKDNWKEGFVSLINIQTKDINGVWITVCSEKLTDDNYQITENDRADLLGEFKNQDIVRCEFKNDMLYAVEKIIE